MSFDINKGLKLKELYVEKFKILKDFKISFCDKNGNPLPIIVLAGINGSGKSTLLETIFCESCKSMKQYSYFNINKNNNYKNTKISYLIIYNGEEKKINGFLNEKEEYTNMIINIPFIDDASYPQNSILKQIETSIPFFIDKLIYEKDILASKAYKKTEEYIKEVLKDLNVGFYFSRLDANKQVYFKNITGDEFRIDELSSGEKTLFLKILYLYFGNFTDSIIIIDEPELSLHPTWQSRILKLYEKFAIRNNCQIIMATHSPQIIASAKPEYLRVLTFDENKKIKVLDNFTKSYGLEFQKVLLEIMGVKELRVPEIEEKFNKLKEYIHNKNSQKFKELFNELETILGSDDTDLQLLKLQANLKGLNV